MVCAACCKSLVQLTYSCAHVDGRQWWAGFAEQPPLTTSARAANPTGKLDPWQTPLATESGRKTHRRRGSLPKWSTPSKGATVNAHGGGATPGLSKGARASNRQRPATTTASTVAAGAFGTPGLLAREPSPSSAGGRSIWLIPSSRVELLPEREDLACPVRDWPSIFNCLSLCIHCLPLCFHCLSVCCHCLSLCFQCLSL